MPWLVSSRKAVLFETDQKTSYVGLAKEVFGSDRLVHRRTSSRLPRTVANPFFPINHTEALARDLMGRLRRESWLVSKARRYLDLGLQIFMAYRNLVRRRFNYDERSPAEMLGFAPRRLTETEILGWRQDGGRRASIRPLLDSSKDDSTKHRSSVQHTKASQFMTAPRENDASNTGLAKTWGA